MHVTAALTAGRPVFGFLGWLVRPHLPYEEGAGSHLPYEEGAGSHLPYEEGASSRAVYQRRPRARCCGVPGHTPESCQEAPAVTTHDSSRAFPTATY